MHETVKSKHGICLSAREAVLKALIAFRRDNAWPDLVLGKLIEQFFISARDAALATRILNGVLQNLFLCDYYIACFSSIDLKKIEPRVLDILRLSVYQIVFMDKIPANAAVNEGVILVKKNSNPRAAGFVNAVLRKTVQAVESSLLPDIAGDMVQRLSIKYSHPQWFIMKLSGILDDESIEAFLKADNKTDLPVSVQVNTLLTDIDNALAVLREDGVEAVRHNWLDNCIDLRCVRHFTRLNAYKSGFIYVQDAAARLAVIAAGPKPGDLVIDGCAAPGGKSFASAIVMGNSGKIIANDIYESKLQRLEESAGRLGITIIDVICRDITEITPALHGADVVFADVPCSGFGIIRKRPDIRFKSELEISGLPDIQRKILMALSTYVKPGGILLYSTCTIFRRENECIIEEFLRDNKQFYTESFSLPGIGFIQEGMITLWPHIHDTDGFFICKLRRAV